VFSPMSRPGDACYFAAISKRPVFPPKTIVPACRCLLAHKEAQVASRRRSIISTQSPDDKLRMVDMISAYSAHSPHHATGPKRHVIVVLAADQKSL